MLHRIEEIREAIATGDNEGALLALRMLDHDLTNIHEAVSGWLSFDGNVEPPSDDAPYRDRLRYEQAKMEITEEVARQLTMIDGR